MKSLVFSAASEQDTDRLGAALAAALPPGATIALLGTLGAGKTRLVQAIAAATGIDRDEVTSPTFVLCQQYRGGRTLYHFDAYRLRDEDEFRELGPEECFESDGLTLVEWADKVRDSLPDERLEIEIAVTGPSQRQFAIRAIGASVESALEQIGLLLAR